MANLKLFKLNIAFVLPLFVSTVGLAQKNYIKNFNVSDSIEVSVNTSFTNIIFETWNKNKIEVEAFIDNDQLSDNEKQVLMENWDLSVMGNSKEITISSNAENEFYANSNISKSDFVGPLLNDLVTPMVSNIQEPPLPKGLMGNIGYIQFDYEAFQKDGEAYMKKFEAQMDKKFGKDFQKKMEDLDKNVEKFWSDKKDSIGKSYGKKMEDWGKAYEKKMEAWGNKIAKKYGNVSNDYTKMEINRPNGVSIVIQGSRGNIVSLADTKKTIIIRLPKNTKTSMNIRHGSLKMTDANNVKATLDYTPFEANSIDGGQTLINAAYAPVVVNNWKQGTLNVKFVDECKIRTTENINLQSSSSDVKIANLTKQASISGSFGDLIIKKIADDFQALDILLKNTDAVIKLPDTAFTFYFNGKKSTLKHPKSLQLNETKRADGVLVKGYSQSNDSNKIVNINATYSDVALQ